MKSKFHDLQEQKKRQMAVEQIDEVLTYLTIGALITAAAFRALKFEVYSLQYYLIEGIYLGVAFLFFLDVTHMKFVEEYFKFIKTLVGKGVIMLLVSFLAFYREELRLIHLLLGMYLFFVGTTLLIFSCILHRDRRLEQQVSKFDEEAKLREKEPLIQK